METDSKASIKELRELVRTLPGTTLAARLRTLMPDIDQRVQDGVQHEDIIQTLNEVGFELNLNTFRSYLYRYRKKVREAQQGTKS